MYWVAPEMKTQYLASYIAGTATRQLLFRPQLNAACSVSETLWIAVRGVSLL